MSIPVDCTPWKLPPYCLPGGPYPQNGPDRARFTHVYDGALQEGLVHEAAVERARGQLKLLHVLLKTLGTEKTKRCLQSDFAMGVPLEQLGDRAPAL